MLKNFIFPIFALFFVSNLAIAHSTFYMGASEITITQASNNSKQLEIHFKQVGNTTIRVQLLDDTGTTLQTNQVKSKKAYTLRYHLKGIETGIYRLSFETTTITFLQPIEVKNGNVMVLSEELLEQHKPIFRNENNRLFINALNASKKPIRIEIVDEEGNKILKDSTSNEFSYGRVFDFNPLPKGEYTVLVRLEGKVYYYAFSR